jgi:hypothetical protein
MREREIIVRYPGIRGNLRILTSSCPEEEGRIYIEGDPEGLRSLAALLEQLAGVDQQTLPSLPESGAAEHVHLERRKWLTPQSAREVVVGRLDDKAGCLDVTFRPRKARPHGIIEHHW